ncbi:uncharacterized protein ALTATR162_LOCUS5112 [Alternaria atra]|uniref:Fungal N-terminal domain-containing protein n=1 Tax=Alternaria atra TaxID=119953 RepID=A0A8J2HZS8_9PLEO|nr:uncharacterized protein ALTATR162_LOCUS5112 [Alternaria atra]CAG5158502.1 unnamed protein product [Alternaria atra]
MEPISLALGIIGLPAAFSVIVKELRKTVKSIRYAKRELQALDEEIDLFAGSYDDFLDTCDEASLSTKGTQDIKRHLISWTGKVMEGFDDLLSKVQALARDPDYDHSAIEVFTAHYRWIMSKSTLKYLRASLNVARQSMIAFTNIRVLGKLNEELAYLRSALSSAERQQIELRHGMTMEERIEIVQKKTCNRRTQRHKIDTRLKEVVKEIKVYKAKDIDQNLVPQREPLLQFQRSVDRYVDHIVFQDRSDRRARRVHGNSSVVTSRSITTTRTESTQPSAIPSLAPESPPTSPEPSIADPDIEIQPDKEEAISILNSCQRCSGTCTKTEDHNTSIRQPPPDPRSHTMGYIPSTTPGPFSMQANEITGSSASSRPWMSRVYQTLPSSSEEIPASDSDPNTHQLHPPQPGVEPADEAREIPHIDLATPEGDEDDFQDGAPEESTSTEEEARGSRTNIWKATGGFEGDMPKGLRIRRQRSRSPQDFW